MKLIKFPLFLLSLFALLFCNTHKKDNSVYFLHEKEVNRIIDSFKYCNKYIPVITAPSGNYWSKKQLINNIANRIKYFKEVLNFIEQPVYNPDMIEDSTEMYRLFVNPAFDQPVIFNLVINNFTDSGYIEKYNFEGPIDTINKKELDFTLVGTQGNTSCYTFKFPRKETYILTEKDWTLFSSIMKTTDFWNSDECIKQKPGTWYEGDWYYLEGVKKKIYHSIERRNDNTDNMLLLIKFYYVYGQEKFI